MKKTILITGGAGFIGSNFIRYIINNSNYKIINFDILTYAGNLENLKDIENNVNYTFIKGDISDYKQLNSLLKYKKIDIIMNFAAETHVDRSIINSNDFIKTNIVGTYNLLEFAKKRNIKRFIQISTDEVYGDLKSKRTKFKENTSLNPTSPYAASKASADLLVMSAYKTFSLPVNITRCSNNYGPYQFPEKLIPLVIYRAMNNKKIPIYGDGNNIRDWIHVFDHCRALYLILKKGKIGEIYNIGANNTIKNIDIVKSILKIMKKDYDLIEFVKDRKAHDIKYAINNSKIKKQFAFKPNIKFSDGLKETVNWYLNNINWVNSCINGEYLKYYNKNYKNRK